MFIHPHIFSPSTGKITATEIKSICVAFQIRWISSAAHFDLGYWYSIPQLLQLFPPIPSEDSDPCFGPDSPVPWVYNARGLPK
jgi:hypothetical protein